MLGKQHQTSGVAVWIGIAPWIDVHNLGLIAIGIPVVCVTTLLPDIDSPRSTVASALGPVGRVISSGPLSRQARNSLPIRWLARQLGPFGALLRGLKHRGASHWVSTWLVVHYFVSTTTTLHWLGAAVAVGAITATCGDALTVEGSPLLGPFRTRPVRLPRLKWRWNGRNQYLGTFRTGGSWEKERMAPLFRVAIPVATIFTLTQALTR